MQPKDVRTLKMVGSQLAPGRCDFTVDHRQFRAVDQLVKGRTR